MYHVKHIQSNMIHFAIRPVNNILSLLICGPKINISIQNSELHINNLASGKLNSVNYVHAAGTHDLLPGAYFSCHGASVNTQPAVSRFLRDVE